MKRTIVLFGIIIVMLTGHVTTLFSQEAAPLEERTIEAVNTGIDNGINIPFIDLAVRQANDNQEVTLSIQILIFLAILTLSPSILILLNPNLAVCTKSSR